MCFGRLYTNLLMARAEQLGSSIGLYDILWVRLRHQMNLYNYTISIELDKLQ
jgi:hypothetical protein